MGSAGWMLRAGLLAAGLLAAACGGPGERAAGNPDRLENPPAAPLATQEPDPWFLPTPRVKASANATLTPPQGALGLADRDAAALLSAALTAAGGNPAAVEVFVFPLRGTGKNLLVVEIDSSSTAFSQAAARLTAGNATNLLPADFFTSKAVGQARVSRVVINIRGKDPATGSFVFSMTLPVETLAGYLAGTISEEQASKVTQFQFKEIKP